MADKKISQLTPATTPLAGTEELPIVQGGSTVKISVNNLTAGKPVTASQLTVENNSSSNAVRITQTGAGNALVVEDSVNPDATPFVVSASGNVGIGTSSPPTKLSVLENANATTAVQVTNADVGASANARFVVSNGTNFGGIIMRGTGTTDANNLVLYSASLTAPIVFTLGGIERARIDSSTGNVGIGTSSPNAAARLDVSSTTSGFLPPRMTEAQRDLIATPPNGLILYNTTTDKLQVRAAGVWVDLH